MQFRRMDLETEPLIVQGSDGVANDEVGEFEDSLFHDTLCKLNGFARQRGGDGHGGVRVEVENDSSFDVSLDHDEGGYALAAINLLFHIDVTDLGGTLERFRQDSV